jgi:hypothetical protein
LAWLSFVGGRAVDCVDCVVLGNTLVHLVATQRYGAVPRLSSRGNQPHILATCAALHAVKNEIQLPPRCADALGLG